MACDQSPSDPQVKPAFASARRMPPVGLRPYWKSVAALRYTRRIPAPLSASEGIRLQAWAVLGVVVGVGVGSGEGEEGVGGEEAGGTGFDDVLEAL
ncbi:hypothetical protein, partial [Xanthobacter agilis]|uniref:hypothetical protein n=1 Tax=Xanthobacter agilis TaxID=47492 RepID=UPI0027D78CEC